MTKKDNTLSTVISGSFRKHLKEIVMLKLLLQEENISVLSPAGDIAVNPDEEFIILDSDPVENPELLQSSIFAKMRQSTFLVLANFEGYIGKAAALEIGYAVGIGIKVYSIEPVEDPNLAPYCTPIEKVFPEIKNKFTEKAVASI